MRHVRNHTNMKLAISVVFGGYEHKLVFPAREQIAVQDDIDAGFRNNEEYRKLFDRGELEYVSKEDEIKKDGFRKYLIRYSFDWFDNKLKLVLTNKLRESCVIIKYSYDDSEVIMKKAVVGQNGEVEVEVPYDIKESFEFAVYNDFETDFIWAYSPRIRMYK